MKVILLQDVAKIGKRSDVVDVPDGYAMNQLIPKRMAEPATAQNQKRVAKLQADAEATRAADRERFEKAQAALTETKVTIAMETNELGHLFKAVSEKDIAEAAQAVGIDIDEAMIQVGDPIKEVGEHPVKLIRGEDVADFTIEVAKKEA
jgi:large subunit ribosomal protein L9